LAYLLDGSERTLLRANELGRQALANGLGVLDMVVMHHSSLDRLDADNNPAHKVNLKHRAAAEFLSEALSPFESHTRVFAMPRKQWRESYDSRQWYVTSYEHH